MNCQPGVCSRQNHTTKNGCAAKLRIHQLSASVLTNRCAVPAITVAQGSQSRHPTKPHTQEWLCYFTASGRIFRSIRTRSRALDHKHTDTDSHTRTDTDRDEGNIREAGVALTCAGGLVPDANLH